MSSEYFSTHTHVVPCQHIRGYFRATANSQEEVLQLALKQYVPLDNVHPQKGDVTIIACHAVGFPKELYEPFFDHLYVELRNRKVKIRGIWIADAASNGESSVLNEGKLGNDPHWDDHARDLLHAVNLFRDQMPRPVIGIGHSMGGAQIVQLALLHPRLLTSVVSIEPIINKQHKGMNFASAYGMSYRRDVWPSREAAMAESRKIPLHQTWDERVMKLWTEHGFRNLPTLLYEKLPQNAAKAGKSSKGDTPVTLSTTKHHNVLVYSRGAFPPPGQSLESFRPDPRVHDDLTAEEASDMQSPLYRPEAILTFRGLPRLRPSCLYMYGATSPFTSASPQSRAEKLDVTGVAVGGSGGVAAGQVDQIVLQEGGHFVVFEKPTLVANEVSTWIGKVLENWQREEAIEHEEWHKVGLRERAMVPDGWMYWMKQHYGKPSTTATPTRAAKQRKRISPGRSR